MRLLHIPKTGGTSLLISGIPGGHHVTYQKGEKYITLIRNPVDWSVSYFSEQTEKSTCDMRDWFKDKYYNFQTKWLAKKILNKEVVNSEVLKEIINILNEFKVIPTDQINRYFKLHLNKARKAYKPTKKEIAPIKLNNSLDFELYKWAKNKEITARPKGLI